MNRRKTAQWFVTQGLTHCETAQWLCKSELGLNHCKVAQWLCQPGLYHCEAAQIVKRGLNRKPK